MGGFGGKEKKREKSQRFKLTLRVLTSCKPQDTYVFLTVLILKLRFSTFSLMDCHNHIEVQEQWNTNCGLELYLISSVPQLQVHFSALQNSCEPLDV